MVRKDEFIEQAVAIFRKNGNQISNPEIEEVAKMCERKIEISGKQEEYFKLLFPEELQNYIFRRTINEITFSVMEEIYV